MGAIRTFIAFETPARVREKISELQLRLKESFTGVRWESPDKFHITIKFLGNVKKEQMPEILEGITGASKHFSRFQVTYEHVGAFPHLKNPRVLWVGCRNDDGILAGLKVALDNALMPYGFEIEERSFHPHLTLGRIKDPGRTRHLTPMSEYLTFEPQTFGVESIVVMKSDLRPNGSVYTPLMIIPLL